MSKRKIYIIGLFLIVVLVILFKVFLTNREPAPISLIAKDNVKSSIGEVQTSRGTERLEAFDGEEESKTLPNTAVAGGAIAGIVRASDGRPVVEATVSLLIYMRFKDKYVEPDQSESRTTTTGTDGTFEISGLTAKKLYGLKVIATGYIGQITEHIPADRRDVIITLQYGASISGRVLREDTNEPIEGASVRFWGRTTKSDSQGHYILRDLPPMSGLYVEAASCEPLSEVSVTEGRGRDGAWNLISDPVKIILKEGESKQNVNLYLYPALSISGWVVMRDTDEPVPGVTVKLRRKGTADMFYGCGDTTSGSKGEFSFGGLSEGHYELKIDGHGKYYTEFNELEHESSLDFMLWKSENPGPIIIKVGCGRLLFGYITDEAGEAIVDVRVNLSKFMRGYPSVDVYSRSLADGSYQIQNLPPNERKFRISFESRDYVKAEEIVEFEEDETEKELNVVLSEGLMISGHVVDSASNPIEGVIIWASGKDRIRVKTDSEGYYAVRGITEGKWRLTALKKGYVRKVEDAVFVFTEDIHNVDFVLEVPDYAGMDWISGRVIVDQDQLPDDFRMICLLEMQGKPSGGGEIKLDENGKFTINNIPEGVYDLTFISSTNQYTIIYDMGARKTFYNVPTGTDDLIVKFTTAGWITGRVIDAATGEPVKGFMTTTCIWNEEKGRYDYMALGFPQDNSIFKIVAPCTGTFKLEVVSFAGYAKYLVEDIVVTEKGFPEELLIELEEQKCQITGIVCVEPELPTQPVFVRDAEVKLRKKGSKNGFTLSPTTTNEGGIFVVEPPDPGHYDLQIEHPDYDTKIIESIDVDGKKPKFLEFILLPPKDSSNESE